MSLIKNFKNFKDQVVTPKADFYKNLKNGQSPKTLFITCSDSRILPNHVTGTVEGELFVIRNAGNALPKFGQKTDLATSATIEYAIMVLGVEEIVVCGHAHCGAVSARTDQSKVPTECGYLHDYLNTLPEFSGSDIENNIKANVSHQIDNLLTYPYVKEAFDQKKLALRGWIYHFDEGNLEVMDAPGAEFSNWENHI